VSASLFLRLLLAIFINILYSIIIELSKKEASMFGYLEEGLYDERLSLVDKSLEVVDKEQQATMEVLSNLAEVERQSVHLWAGYRSLYAYCTIKLGYSEPAAVRRIKAARLLRRFPLVKELLKSRQLNLTTVGILADVLKAKNMSSSDFEKLLVESAGKSRTELLESLGRIGAVPESLARYDLRDQVVPVFLKKIVPNKTGYAPSGLEVALAEMYGRFDDCPNSTVVTEKRLKLTFSADPTFEGKLQKMQQLLFTKHYGAASLADIFSEAMDYYIERHYPVKKSKRTSQRQDSKAVSSIEKHDKKTNSRYIPAKVKTEVLLRDGYQCSYVAPDGTRCDCTGGLEVDHIQPFAAGGSNEPDNLRLLCKAHNLHAAEEFYGYQKMAVYRH
jgi:5-methylcytosine-specific restriction endonuclease McrA